MSNYKIADISLGEQGLALMQMVEDEMKGLLDLRKQYSSKRVFSGTRISFCGHITLQTTVLIQSLVDCGAEVRCCACDPLTTCDKAAAVLARAGISVFARKGATCQEFEGFKEEVLTFKDGGPHIVLDYGCILTTLIHEKHPNLLKGIKGIVEHISIAKYYKILKKSSFKGPVFNCIESKIRNQFEDIYGMREAVVDVIKRSTNIQIAGKRCLICGFGEIGKGIAYSMKSLGAHVVVNEIDPINALQAEMEGYEVNTLDDSIYGADIVITASSIKKYISGKHILKMKDKAILANLGYENGSIDIDWIHKNSTSHIELLPRVDRYTFDSGKSIILLSQGSLAQLNVAHGYPSFLMSISFSVTFLSAIELQDFSSAKYPTGVCMIPRKLDEQISEAHLLALGGKLEKLTPEQAECMGVPINGPFKQYPLEF